MNGAQSVIDTLTRSGTDTVFGLPGSTEAALLAALRARPGVRYVLALHEGAAVSMADGYARVTGKPGVVGLHTTVGTLNGASQVYNAYQDNSPVVVLAGHKDRTVLSESGFCAHPHLPEVVRPFTKWAHQTLSAAELGRDVWRALHAAMRRPRGPAYLAVPEDYLRDTVPAAAPVPPTGNTSMWSESAGLPDLAAVDRAAAVLSAARWPVIVVGSQAADCVEDVRALADAMSVPVLCTDLTDVATLPYPTADPRYLGLYGEDPAVLDGCDAVLSVGARCFYPFSATRHPRLPAGAKLVHVHPDPAQLGGSLATEVAIAADPAATLRALLTALGGGQARADRAGRLRDLRAAREQSLRSEREQSLRSERDMPDVTPLPVDSVAVEIGRVLPDDAIVVDEGVRSSARLLRHLEIGDGHILMRSSGGALGWGVPAAVGAGLGQPGRPVLAVVGDGSYHFSVQAIWTAVQHQVSLVVVVLDNGGYLAVKRAIEGYLGKAAGSGHPGTRLPGIDHAQVAAGYGAAGGIVERAADIGAAVKDAFDTPGVTVLTVPVAEVRP